jgi:hypothetical protein
VPLKELTCLNCGYRFYGLSEMRCPECGNAFTWEQVLDDYRRRRKPFFEYRWRRQPVRSLTRTWIWALRPSRLWTRFDIHDPPQVGPLIALVIISLVGFVLSVGLDNGFRAWLRAWYFGRRGAGWQTTWLDLPRFILDGFRFVTTEAFLAVAWVAASFAALMVFRQSMRRCKVRTVHVLRVWAHAAPLMLPLAVGVFFTVNCLCLFLRGGGWYLPAVAMVMLPAYATWSLGHAYKRYLRVPHSFAVAFASQLIAALGAVAAYDTIGPGGLGASILIEIDSLIGLW